ncbi:PLP-dependent aminotransferase family protein [Actinomadura barringtoniae]|uniref:PLP-dependent aminotransferase family protein n=1 Tax=Actinomadura barringtoniae TaxID=1427535 RepID=A0A939PCA0_9ACTN|nr:PLP-dependent aminotransferase family protein [Actinomadura barringtoniae]MBO2449960.1 PLP-dependent aminotransferase family protein [Actinomadura barringtoniae]
MSTRYVSGTQLARLLGDVPHERPYYAALARAVRGLILDGRLALRTRLPAERDLATALGVSRTTVTAAYDRLRDEGFVESRQGAGSWTALPPTNMSAPAARGLPSVSVPFGAGQFGMAYAPEGPGFIDLGCATPAAPAIFDEAVAAGVASLARYSSGPGYEPAGIAELRETIAATYEARGVPTRPDQIVVTTGAQHAFTLLIQALVEPGDSVLVERPTYPHALGALRRRGARLVPVGVNEGWDLELIAGSMRQAAVRVAYTIPDFQNPTGRLMGDADRAALVEAARRADAFVIADETFAELAHDPAADRMPPMAGYDTGGRVITIGSSSKLMWGGLRIGWIRATAPLARRIVLAREAVDMASPVLDQLIVRELLLRLGEVRAERASHLVRSRDALAAALRERMPDWEFTLPDGGMSLWVRLGAPVASLLAEAAGRYGVRVVPGPVFGVDGVLEDCVRLPYVLPPDVLRAAVDRLAQAYREVEAAPLAGPLPAYV